MDTTDNPGQPTTAEVLAEVERRRAAASPPVSEGERRVVVIADRFIFWLSKHWLAVFNLLAFLYVGLPFLAPVLLALGAPGPARLIYALYAPLCHQLPQRSWFLFGPQWAYTLPELIERLGANLTPELTTRAFVGDASIGYKVALCQRDSAIYGAIVLFGLAYAPLRRRWKVPPLSWWVYIVFGILPMMIDGGYQFLSYALAYFWPGGPISPHETTPLLRVITGALFGLATTWLAYPYIQESMDDIRKTLHQRFGWQ